MKRPRRFPALSSLAAGAFLASGALAASACGKSVQLGETSGTEFLSGCADSARLHWQFTQPLSAPPGSADLLFVLDTSRSLDDKRARLAAAIPAFLKSLPAATDLNIGVMLAHGGASRYSGALYSSRPSIPLVLKSTALTANRMQADLETDLLNPVADADEAGGEMMMYSSLKSLDQTHLPRIQAHDFYRDSAALSVIYISDENDICYPPEAHGFTAFPDFSPDPTGNEAIAYSRYCANPDGSPKLTPESVIAAYRSLKTNGKLSFAGVIHVDPSGVPSGTEEAIGHGILELVQGSGDGLLLDIGTSDYAPAFTRLASTVTNQLTLLTAFHLESSGPIDGGTLLASVDGAPVAATLDPATGTMAIHLSDAGHPGSVVSASACP